MADQRNIFALRQEGNVYRWRCERRRPPQEGHVYLGVGLSPLTWPS